jgi:hypothetical protein
MTLWENPTRVFVQEDFPHNEQRIYEYENGYGASVVRGIHTYGGPTGLWELGVLHFGQLDYSTPITSDVIGYLTEDEVEGCLESIKALAASDAVSEKLPTASLDIALGAIGFFGAAAEEGE